MHEFSICQTIVEIVLKELRKAGMERVRLKSVKIAVGKYHQIVPENLTFAYEVLTKDTPAENSLLEIEILPILVQCKSCNRKGEIVPPLYRCETCSSGDVEVVGGKELLLESLEVISDD